MNTLNIDDDLNDIQFNLTSQIHFINITNDGEYFIYLAVDRSKANLGITKKVLSTYKQSLENEL